MSFVNCRHWSRSESPRSGICALGLAGGRPTVGYCVKHCQQRSPTYSDSATPRPISLPQLEDVKAKLTAIRTICAACSEHERFLHADGVRCETHVKCRASRCAHRTVALLGVCPRKKFAQGVVVDG